MAGLDQNHQHQDKIVPMMGSKVLVTILLSVHHFSDNYWSKSDGPKDSEFIYV